MGMLAVEEGLCSKALAGLKQEGVAASRDARGVQAEHRSCLESPPCEGVACHQHDPIERAKLLTTARAALPIVLEVGETMGHEIPAADHDVSRRERDRVRNPGGPGPHPIRRNT